MDIIFHFYVKAIKINIMLQGRIQIVLDASIPLWEPKLLKDS